MTTARQEARQDWLRGEQSQAGSQEAVRKKKRSGKSVRDNLLGNPPKGPNLLGNPPFGEATFWGIHLLGNPPF